MPALFLLETENFNLTVVSLVVYMFVSHFDLISFKPWGMYEGDRLLLFLLRAFDLLS